VDLVVARCAGLDVGKHEVVACVRTCDGAGGRAQEIRTFTTFSADVEAMFDWLVEAG
jgi:transposase